MRGCLCVLCLEQKVAHLKWHGQIRWISQCVHHQMTCWVLEPLRMRYTGSCVAHNRRSKCHQKSCRWSSSFYFLRTPAVISTGMRTGTGCGFNLLISSCSCQCQCQCPSAGFSQISTSKLTRLGRGGLRPSCFSARACICFHFGTAPISALRCRRRQGSPGPRAP